MHFLANLLPAILTIPSTLALPTKPIDPTTLLKPEILAAGNFTVDCGCWNQCTLKDFATGVDSSVSTCDQTCGQYLSMCTAIG